MVMEDPPGGQATLDKNIQVFLVTSLHTYPMLHCTKGAFCLGDGLESQICPPARFQGCSNATQEQEESRGSP